MNRHILKLLSFRLSGKFAHFRKFYTNSSSLSYLIPPRTAVIGMLGSVLEYPRDSYYDVFGPESFKISVSVTPGTLIKKQMQSLNYLHADYHKFLTRGGQCKSMHTQCKLELLLPAGGHIDYTVYVGGTSKAASEILNNIETRIKSKNLGYGIYLGQRQFRADADDVQVFEEIPFREVSDHVDSLCLQENAELDVSENTDRHIVMDQMPIQMQKETQAKKGKKQADPGRVPDIIKRVLSEKTGKRIFGTFRNCYRIGEKTISFYEG